MRGNSSVDLEMEIVYGRRNSGSPADPPVPDYGDKYIVFGFDIGLVTGVVVGGVLGATLPIGSVFLTAAAGAFIGGFIGTFAGDRHKARKLNRKGSVNFRHG